MEHKFLWGVVAGAVAHHLWWSWRVRAAMLTQALTMQPLPVPVAPIAGGSQYPQRGVPYAQDTWQNQNPEMFTTDLNVRGY